MMTPSFPPPGYIRTETAVPGIDVWMPKPPDENQQEVVQFHCPQCDATTAFSTDGGGITCAHCGYYEAPQAALVGKGAQQFEFTVETMARVAQGWGIERKELACNRCNAHVTIATDMLTHICPFCHSNQVVQVKAPQDVLRPRFLLPFQVDADTLRRQTAAWLGSSWLLPKDVQRLAPGTEFTPIYVPAWTFDAQTSAGWKAEVAHTRTRTVGIGKNRRTQTYTEWRWESGQATLTFDDLLINGASNLSPVLLNQIRHVDLTQLVAYEPHYLAGIQAQAYDVSLDAAWERARQNMRAQTKEACQRQATSQRMRNFSMNLDFRDESWRYILLPLYIAVYHYNNQPYQLLANGQNGQIAGQRPVDWRKIIVAIGAALLPALLLGLLATWMLVADNANGNVVLFVTFGLVALALIFAGITVSQALKMDDV
ncbi:MAG: hypothetical protein KJ069_18225 [Anaerolineae bacterium]|nr:hypothetical protein [Anaerolineae bacterium]